MEQEPAEFADCCRFADSLISSKSAILLLASAS